MKLSEVRDLLQADVLNGEAMLEEDVESVFASDFMSDILAFSQNETVLMTGMVNPQVIRTAEMVDMKCVIFVRGKLPDDDIMKLAKEDNMIIMSTKMLMYEACGILYSNNLGRNKNE